jgi:phosphate transport system substrate-binding protein
MTAETRPRPPRTLPLLAALAASGALAVGCSGPTDAGGSGDVKVDGSSTVYPISLAVQEAFSQAHPRARIIVSNHGTGGGFGAYNAGEADIVDASRPAKAEEEARAKAQGFDWTRYVVGHDGITVVVNRDNDWADALSAEQLRALFAPDSRVKTWKQLDDRWPDRPIKLFTPDDDSGTFDFFTEVIVGEEGVQRKDVQPSADDNVLVTGVAGDRDALGYFGFAYYLENKDKLRPVPIRAGADAAAVEPTLESIFDGSYRPLSRPLFIYVKNEAMDRPEVAEFVAYYLDEVARFATEAGYVAPTEAERSANREALAKAKGGPPAAE